MSKKYIQPKITSLSMDTDALLIDTSVPEGSDTPKGADGTTDLSGAEAKKSFFYDEEGW